MSALQHLEVQDRMQCRDFANAVMNVRCGSHGAVDNTARLVCDVSELTASIVRV